MDSVGVLYIFQLPAMMGLRMVLISPEGLTEPWYRLWQEEPGDRRWGAGFAW
jgi:hypothetical protein